ncbi:MAG: hypothetical protein IPO08_07570 [Xanthomonadales bacterium]|nr:hypothetical protein [Xanthomonadales bacterium]
MKMRMTRIVLVFLGVFWAVQKALPLLFRQGEFRGIGWTESLDWLTSFNSGIVSVLVGAFVLMFCVWPLRTYSLFVTIPVAAGHSIFCRDSGISIRSVVDGADFEWIECAGSPALDLFVYCPLADQCDSTQE